MSFGADLRRFSAKTEKKMEQAARKIALDAFSEVILKTPVDTGRARGNWQVAIGSVPSGTVEIDDKEGTATIGAVQAQGMGLKIGDVIYLANNLPYIERLEEGSSKQAPAGMVRLTQQRWQAIAHKVFTEIGRT
jgi:hypothetical protein